DVYCVVLKDWETTNSLLTDPFEAFRAYKGQPSFTSPADPMFLYDYNSMGAPANVPFLLRNRQTDRPFNDPQTTVLQSQIDEIRKQGVATVTGVQQIVGQQGNSIAALEASQEKIFQGIAALSSVISSGHLLATQNSSLQGLLSQRSTLNLILSTSANQQVTALLTAQLDALNKQISEQEVLVAQARNQVSALNHHFSPI
ncbi:hypothetical protein R3P38DRAFT_2420199, partial [Favolaschia claudopus]